MKGFPITIRASRPALSYILRYSATPLPASFATQRDRPGPAAANPTIFLVFG